MADNRDYDIFHGNNFYSNTTSGITQVTVEGIADKALQGIHIALANMNTALHGIRTSINQGNDDAEHERDATDRDKARDERNNRARYNALSGNINKATSVLDSLSSILKNSLEKLTGMLKDGFAKSLRAYDEFAKQMRQLKISTADKKLAELKADQAFNAAEAMGFHISKSDVQDFSLSLVGTPEFNQLTDSQLALAAQLKSNGYDNESILKMFRLFGNDIDKLKTIALRSTDRTVVGAMQSLTKKLGESDWSSAADRLGKTEGEFYEYAQSMARELASRSGGNLTQEQIADLVETELLIKGGQTQSIDEEKMKRYLIVTGGADSVAEGIENLKKMNADTARNNLTALKELAPDLSTSLNTMVQSVASGNFKEKGVESDTSLAERNEQNTPEGKFNQWIQKGVSWLNTATGGLISDFSVELDEMFGGALGTDDILQKGFAHVVSLMKSIRNGQILGSGGITGMLKNFGSKALPLLGSIVTKIPVVAAGAAAAAGVYGAIASIHDSVKRDNRYEDAKKELADAQKQKAIAEANLEKAKGSKDAYLIEKYQKEVDALNKKIPQLEKERQDAYEKRTAASETYHNSKKKTDSQTQANMSEIDRLRALRDKAKKEADERAKAESKESGKKVEPNTFAVDDYNRQINELLEKNKALRDRDTALFEESNSALTTGIASLTSAFGYEFGEEQMLAWHGFKNGISDWFDKTGKDIEAQWNQFTTGAGKAFSAVGDFFGDLWGGVTGTYDESVKVASGYIEKADQFFTGIYNDAAKGWGNFTTGLSQWWGDFETSLSKNWGDFTTDLSQGWDSVKTWWNDLSWDDITGSISEGWDSITQWWKDLSWDDITDSISKGWDDFSNSLSKGWDDFKTGLSDGWDSFKSLFFAEGGIVDKPTPAVIGEAGKELVLPLTNQRRINELLNQLSPTERDSLLRALGREDIASSGKFAESLNKLNNSSEWYGDLGGDVETSMLDSIGDTFLSAFDSIGDIFSSTTDSISDSISSLFGFGKESANTEESVDKNVSRILEALVNVNKTIDNIFGIEQKIELEFRDNTIQRFATGGIVNRPTKSIVGENGTEVILPLTDKENLAKTIDDLSDYEKQILLNSLLGRGLSKDLFDALAPIVDATPDGLAKAARQLANGNISRVNLDERFDVNKLTDFGAYKNYELASDLSGIVSETLRRVAQQYAMAASKIIDDDGGNKDEIYASLNTIIRYLSQIAASNKKQIVATKPIPMPYK